MNKIAGNDLLEIYATHYNGTPHQLHHERFALDGHAKMMLALVQAWGAAHFVGDAMKDFAEAGGGAKIARNTVGNIVFLAAETVQAMYDEADKRGWTVAIGELGGDRE